MGKLWKVGAVVRFHHGDSVYSPHISYAPVQDGFLVGAEVSAPLRRSLHAANSVDGLHPTMKDVIEQIQHVVIGKEDVIRLLFVALLGGGHAFIEDVPGVGKTMLARAVAKALGCEFKRIQCTPDLLPSDVTGISVYDQKTSTFEFRPGPVFGQVVLADEINRATPRAQSALLEALEEKSVSVDGQTHQLPEPFFVLATGNPIEFEGTYPLPEAELDRFLLRFTIGYPHFDDELAMLESHRDVHPIESLRPVATPQDVSRWIAQCREVHVDVEVRRYIIEIVHATRNHPSLSLGGSPRASLALFKSAQALAFLADRHYVVPDDVQFLAPYVLGHRMVLHPEARFRGDSVEDVIAEVLSNVRVPRIETGRGR